MSDSNEGIVARLRNYDLYRDGDIDQAADMIEFLLESLQPHSLRPSGEHSWRFCGGWPLASVRASTAEDAVIQAVAEMKREREAAK